MKILKEFGWFFLIILAVGIIWLLAGGPKKESSNNPFIKPPFPVSSGETYGTRLFDFFDAGAKTDDLSEVDYDNISENSPTTSLGDSISDQLENIEKEAEKIQEELEEAQKKSNESEYTDLISLGRGNARSSDPDREYLEISLSSKAEKKVIITGWEIKSAISGTGVKLEEASWLPRMGAINNGNTIVLSPGEKLIINTGRSPIGVSFRTNICTGYFEQFQNFYPSLRKECPNPEDEIPEEYLSGPNMFNDSCLDFIDRLYRCGINTKEIPWDMQSQCQNFITRDLNYNSCVDRHNNEEGFYGDIWRIFLNRSSELWKSKRELIKLIDSEGKVVDTVSY